jgi:L-fucose mutarotase/ribose pyranase (RbsD/FucU family)
MGEPEPSACMNEKCIRSTAINIPASSAASACMSLDGYPTIGTPRAVVSIYSLNHIISYIWRNRKGISRHDQETRRVSSYCKHHSNAARTRQNPYSKVVSIHCFYHYCLPLLSQ